LHAPKRPRLEKFDYRGRHHYFLNFGTHGKQIVFTHAAVVDQALVNSAIRNTMRL